MRMHNSHWNLVLVIVLLFVTVQVSWVSGAAPARVSLLIRYKNPPGLSEEMFVRQVGGHVKYRYHLVNAMAVSIPETVVPQLIHDSRIAKIEPDLPIRAADEELDNSWGVTRIGAGNLHQESITGEGIGIAIIDSGINYNHPDLPKFTPDPSGSYYAGGYDFIENDDDPMDVYGHGTHVAGIACALDNGNGDPDGSYGVVGVAPACALYSLRVLDDAGWGNSSDLIAALQWALDEKIPVANLSLGWDRYPGETVEEAFYNAEQQGMVIVAAACNNGKWHGRGENVCYPGKFPSVIAVAATDSKDIRASFSSTGPEVELAAPGVSVLSTWNDDSGYALPEPVCRTEDGVQACYKFGSGTSMASPHVAGTAALMIQSGSITDLNSNGRINDEIRQILIDTADDLGDAGWDPWYGYGLVNAYKAVIGEQPPEPTPTPSLTPTLTPTPTSSPSTLTISGIYPASISASSPAPILITLYGTGFSADTVVTFEGGKGAPPNVVSLSVNQAGTELHAEITTKRTPKPVEWSVRVTNPDMTTAILPDALKVTP